MSEVQEVPNYNPPSGLDGSVPADYHPLKVFFVILSSVWLLAIPLAFFQLPASPAVFLLNLGLGAVFLGASVASVFYGASFNWKLKPAVAFFFAGFFVQVLIALFSQKPFIAPALPFLGAVAQVALMTWCLGLGALLTCLFRERNILVPVAITLVFVDMIYVLTPVGHVGRIARNQQKILEKVSVHVPSIRKQEPKQPSQPPKAQIQPQAFIGPADMIFMAMFFVAIFRFNLKASSTLKVMGPAVVVYLLIVLTCGGVRVFGVPLGALPAMIPIAGSMIAVNWHEFQLKRDEKVSVLVLSLVLAALFIALMRMPAPKEPQAAPSTSETAPVTSGSANSLEPTLTRRPR